MSFKTRDGKTHQSTVVMGENGLAVDSIATIAGSYLFLTSDVDPITYSAGSATVTLPVGNDLTGVSTAKARYTGRYVLITKDNSIYYINRNSIDIANRTFMISRSDSALIVPASIDLSPGWQVAEADIVNRLATTSAAKIDSVEFRDMHFQMQLDGDPVTLLNQEGVGINPATEEKQDDQIVELGLINDELDTHTIQLQQINDELNTQTTELQGINSELDGIHADLNSQLNTANTSLDNIESYTNSIDNKISNNYGASTGAIRTASQIGNSTGAADFNAGNSGAQTLRITQSEDDIFSKESKQDVIIERLDNIDARIDAGNTTSTPLANAAIFYGPWTKRTTATVLLAPNSDRSFKYYFQYANSELSTTPGVPVYTDGPAQGLEASIMYTYTAGVTPPIPRRLVVSREYYRVVIVNDSGLNMTRLSFQTSIGDFTNPIIRLNEDLASDSDAIVVRSVTTGQNPNSVYIDSKLTGVVDVASTSIPLAANGTFTSPWIDCSQAASVIVTVLTDQNTASNGIALDFSANGVDNVRSTVATLLGSPNGYFFSVPAGTGTFRLRYINGSVAQTVFRLQTKLAAQAFTPPVVPVSTPINNNTSVLLTKTVITAEDPGGNFVNIQASDAQNLLVAEGQRPAEIRNRIRVSGNVENITLSSTPTNLRTVTVGHTLYVTSIIISALNADAGNGRFGVYDGGTLIIPLLMPPRASGSTPSASLIISPSLPEPIRITTSLQIAEIAGDITASIAFVGYEEPNP